VTLLREGYCSSHALIAWGKANKFPQRMVNDVVQAMELEGFDHDGKVYFRLSGRVVPLVPGDVRDVGVYRSAAREIGGTAA
jgi:hypothetical protein